MIILNLCVKRQTPIFKDGYDYNKICLRCQQLDKIGRKNMMSLILIIVVDIFDV